MVVDYSLPVESKRKVVAIAVGIYIAFHIMAAAKIIYFLQIYKKSNPNGLLFLYYIDKELLFVVPICGQHTQVAAVAPLSVLLSGSEELGCLGWVLLHH